MVWYVFQVTLENTIYMGAFLDQEEMMKEFKIAQDFWGEAVALLGCVSGAVVADSKEEAFKALRTGDWDYIDE